MAGFEGIGEDLFGDVIQSVEEQDPKSGFTPMMEEDLGLEDNNNDDSSQEDTVSTSEPKNTDVTLPDTYLNTYLKKLGFNPEAIKVEDEDGEIQTFKFEELSEQDKLDILNYGREPQPIDVNLGEGWEQVESYIKENNLSFNDFYEQIKEKVLKDYAQDSQPYEIDSLSDEQIYALHLATLYGDEMTDEEIAAEVEKATENSERFNKVTAKLREGYKEEESQKLQQQELLKQRERQEAREVEIKNMVEIARSISDMHNTLDLEDSDKNIILNTLFTEDDKGITEFDKAISDPKTKFKLAWYLKYGDETIQAIHKEYRSQIKELKNSSKPAKPTPPTVVQKQKTPPNKSTSLEDLFFN